MQTDARFKSRSGVYFPVWLKRKIRVWFGFLYICLLHFANTQPPHHHVRQTTESNLSKLCFHPQLNYKLESRLHRCHLQFGRKPTFCWGFESGLWVRWIAFLESWWCCTPNFGINDCSQVRLHLPRTRSCLESRGCPVFFPPISIFRFIAIILKTEQLYFICVKVEKKNHSKIHVYEFVSVMPFRVMDIYLTGCRETFWNANAYVFTLGQQGETAHSHLCKDRPLVSVWNSKASWINIWNV